MDCGLFANPYAPILVENPAAILRTTTSTNAPLDGRILELLELSNANHQILPAIIGVVVVKSAYIQPEFPQNLPRISLLLARMTVDNTLWSTCEFKSIQCVARDQRQNDTDKHLEETCSGRLQF